MLAADLVRHAFLNDATFDLADDSFLTDCCSCLCRRFAGALCLWHGLAPEGASHSIICTTLERKGR